MNNSSTIIYACPVVKSSAEELKSIQNVTDILARHNINVSISPNWADLMLKLHTDLAKEILIVFRLDFLERSDMPLDEVLSMMSSLTKFVATTTTVNIAVIVPHPCDASLITNLKRNNVLGIIPGLRFFDVAHSVEAYRVLSQGKPYWPKIAIKEYSNSQSINDSLTDRQYEIFTLVAKRGLSNKKIAETLNITEDTVKAHVGAVLKKYGVRNRTQLALANRTGIIK